MFNPKTLVKSPWFHPLLLLAWIIVGVALRFFRLEAIAPWTDECATMVYCLGNSFYKVATNQVIGLDALLEPLKPNPSAGISNVLDRLFAESTHPPVYFILTHLWLKLFPLDDGIASLWGARSLSAIFGVLSIPAILYLAWITTHSRLVAQCTATMMAISPFSIFLSQQARHYTLAILLVIFSLSCLVQAIQSIQREEAISGRVALTWVVVNSLGIATHYFFMISLAAQSLVILGFAIGKLRQDQKAWLRVYWRRIYAVAIASAVGCLVWLPKLQEIPGESITDWIYKTEPTVKWLDPIGRFLLWLMSMAFMFPSSFYSLPLWILIVSGIITVCYLLWIVPRLIYRLKRETYPTDSRIGLRVIGGYTLAIIIICFVLTYGFSVDLTQAARFHFLYFPGFLVLLGAAIAACWRQADENLVLPQKHPKRHKFWKMSQFSERRMVISIWLIGLLGGVVTIWQIGYLQSHRPDLMVSVIAQNFHKSTLITTTYKHHGQTGRMTGLAWGFKHLPNTDKNSAQLHQLYQFFLVAQDPKTESYQASIKQLKQQLAFISRPLNLWLVNFRTEIDLKSESCQPIVEKSSNAGEYHYDLLHCQE